MISTEKNIPQGGSNMQKACFDMATEILSSIPSNYLVAHYYVYGI